MVPKIQFGVGSGNQSDDELAFMCFFTLLRLSQNEELVNSLRYAFHLYWRLEQPEMNPFFNFSRVRPGPGTHRNVQLNYMGGAQTPPGRSLRPQAHGRAGEPSGPERVPRVGLRDVGPNGGKGLDRVRALRLATGERRAPSPDRTRHTRGPRCPQEVTRGAARSVGRPGKGIGRGMTDRRLPPRSSFLSDALPSRINHTKL